MKITVRIKSIYGIETVYPVCERATLFSRIAGTKTLTRHTIDHILALGYEIAVERDEPRTFAHLTAA